MDSFQTLRTYLRNHLPYVLVFLLSCVFSAVLVYYADPYERQILATSTPEARASQRNVIFPKGRDPCVRLPKSFGGLSAFLPAGQNATSNPGCSSSDRQVSLISAESLHVPFVTTDSQALSLVTRDLYNLPVSRIWEFDILPYIDKAAPFLQCIQNGCNWSTLFWNYNRIKEDGFETARSRDVLSAAWDQFLLGIGLPPRLGLITWVARLPKGDETDKAAHDGGVQASFNFEAGVMIVNYMYRARNAEREINLSLPDVLFLGWQELANALAPTLKPLPRFILVQNIINTETTRILWTCTGSFNLPAWPGRVWGIHERCGQALLGSPSGQGLGYTIAQRLKLPKGLLENSKETIPFTGLSIIFVRAFRNQDSTVNLLLQLAYTPPVQVSELLNPAGTVGLGATNATTSNSPERTAEVASSHRLSILLSRGVEKWHLFTARGEKVLLAIQSQCANQSPWKSFDGISEAGFREELSEEKLAGPEWDPFLDSIGLTPDDPFQQAYYFRNDPMMAHSFKGGTYAFKFQLQKGIFVSSLTYRVSNPAPKAMSNPSDFMFLAWREMCARHKNEDCELNYVLIEDISNLDTLGAIEGACFPDGTTIPAWPGKDFEIDSMCGRTILGTPNGISIGYMLSQRLDTIPEKTIAQTKVFSPTMPNLIFYLGPLRNEPEAPQRLATAVLASAKPTNARADRLQSL